MYFKLSLLLISQLCLATLPLIVQATHNDSEIHVAFITSFGGEYNSSGVIPAVQLATELINNRHDILSEHELIVELIDDRETAEKYANSNCDRLDSQTAFFRQVTTGVDKVAVIGSGCSRATEATAEISDFWNMTHISYAASSDVLSNRQQFPNFFRTYPQESNLASSVLAIMKEYNWTVLKIITEEASIFTGSTNTLKAILQNNNITVNQEGTTTFTTDTNLVNDTNLFQPEIRVYLLNMYSVHARQILCAAAKNHSSNPDDLRFYFPGYVWITLGWYSDQWWTAEVANDPLTDCRDEQLEELFLPQTLGILQANSASDEKAQTDVMLTAEEFDQQYKQRLNTNDFVFESTAYHAYDAVWTLALGINSSLAELEERDLSLEGFEYSTTATNISKIIQERIQNISFVGVSGEVKFDVNGTRVGDDPRIFQYRNKLTANDCSQRGTENGTYRLVPIATVVGGIDNIQGGNFTYVQCENVDRTWPDGVPDDGEPKERLTTILFPIFIVYTIIVSAGIIFAIVCLLFNFIFRKRKIVRLISPNLNYLIIIGAIMMYAAVYFFIIPTTDTLTVTIACHLRAWLQTVGYFLCFGTIVAKMWRVYYIFHHPQIQKRSRKNSNKRGIQDWHLLIIVGVLISVIVIILTGVAIFGRYGATEVEDNETPLERTDDGKILVEHFNLVCMGPRDTIWIILQYAYIILTQLVGVFLAFRTRKVKIKALNDAKYMAMIIYLTTVIITVMIIGAVILDSRQNADAAVFGGLLTLYTTVVLSLVFIPKMIILYRDPKGQKIFERTYSASQPTLTNVENNEIVNSYNELEKHSKDLEIRLAKYETVAPYRGTSLSISTKLRSGSLNYITPSSPTHRVNPTLSLPVTPNKIPTPTTIDDKMTNATSGYLTEGDRSRSGSAGDRAEKSPDLAPPDDLPKTP